MIPERFVYERGLYPMALCSRDTAKDAGLCSRWMCYIRGIDVEWRPGPKEEKKAGWVTVMEYRSARRKQIRDARGGRNAG